MGWALDSVLSQCVRNFETWDDTLSGYEKFAWTQEELSECCINIFLLINNVQ